jgi:selenide,water dikinase
MAVTGEVHPARLLTNAGLRPGQDIVLTKALGVGVLTTAIKQDRATADQSAAVVASMVRLNDVAARVALEAGATGCTDVTGFGLLGHLGRMALESSVSVTIEYDAVPFLPGAVDLAADGVMPGGSRRNLSWASDFVDAGEHDELHQLLLADAQTSGGLVFGVDPAASADVVAELIATGHVAACIGRADTGRAGLLLR